MKCPPPTHTSLEPEWNQSCARQQGTVDKSVRKKNTDYDRKGILRQSLETHACMPALFTCVCVSECLVHVSLRALALTWGCLERTVTRGSQQTPIFRDTIICFLCFPCCLLGSGANHSAPWWEKLSFGHYINLFGFRTNRSSSSYHKIWKREQNNNSEINKNRIFPLLLWNRP